MLLANYNCQENIVSLALNLLNCDFINIGNHDFNYGPEFLKNILIAVRLDVLLLMLVIKIKSLGELLLLNMRI